MRADFAPAEKLAMTSLLPVFIVGQKFAVGISAVILVVFYRRAIGPLCENVTSSAKPEVHNM